MFEVVAGRYVLIDSIGSGGSGEVWRAFDRKRGEYCAAKVIRQPEAATLVRAVFEQGVRLDHPHVVTPYAWTADDEQVLLAMPLVRGGSLAVLLRDLGVLPARYGAEVLRQLLVALEHVHEAGIVHRDVKPANVLLEPTGTGIPHARLADFGLVLTPDRPRITGMFMVVGTRDYLAPESLERGDQGVAQDLYAAGLVGAEMVGKHAGPLAGLIAALTAPEPARRPESATAALERLAEVLDGWPLHTPVPMPESDEPVEVFEQIGELPAGWGPRGPIEEAETETVEWLWSPDPVEDTRTASAKHGGGFGGGYGGAVGGSGSTGDVEVSTGALGGVAGAEQRTIPGAGAGGGWRAEGSHVGGAPISPVDGAHGMPRGQSPHVGGAPAGRHGDGSPISPIGGVPGEPRGQSPHLSAASGERQADGSPISPIGGVPGGWQGQTLPLSGRSGVPGDRQGDGSPVSQGSGAPGGWQGQTLPLGGRSSGDVAGDRPADGSGGWQEQTVPLGGRPVGPSSDRQAQEPPVGGMPADWQTRTVPLPGGSGSGGSAVRNQQARGPQAGSPSGDWQARTVPLGGAPSRSAGHRQAWNRPPAEPDIDRVRLIPGLITNPGIAPVALAEPSALDRFRRWRWRWAAVAAGAVVVLGVVLALFI